MLGDELQRHQGKFRIEKCPHNDRRFGMFEFSALFCRMGHAANAPSPADKMAPLGLRRSWVSRPVSSHRAK